jgi:hypothetical protein
VLFHVSSPCEAAASLMSTAAKNKLLASAVNNQKAP